jgi:glutathionylspermidine synthase
MLRLPMQERPHWRQTAQEYGFHFHTIEGAPYWDESACYQFNLRQIEEDLEAPTEELHQMCLAVVEQVLAQEELLQRFAIPAEQWDFIRHSWQAREPSLYSRLDLAYNGCGPAKLYENNADTPTSLFETGLWQWLWLEQQVDAGQLPRHADQFNSLQEKLVNRFVELQAHHPHSLLHVTCCQHSDEDRGTVQYLQDCAAAAGIETRFIYIDDIGCDVAGHFTDLDNRPINWLFKLYPWEYLLREDYSQLLGRYPMGWLEPPWKAILSNKALLPMLWRLFPNHPNLLPAFFADELHLASQCQALVQKPLFSREGANIRLFNKEEDILSSDGPYGEEGYIYQQAHLLPNFAGNHTLIGSWLVDDMAAGIAIREDATAITRDTSRFLPHVIV